MDPLASPPRPMMTNPAIPVASPMPPPSVGKQEVNDAAMALTWLAEALTGPGSQSPLVPKTKVVTAAAAPVASLFHAEPVEHRRRVATVASYAPEVIAPQQIAAPVAATNQGRGRRAASQRCNTVVQEAILNERLLSYNPRTLHNMEAAAARNANKRIGSRTSDAAIAAAAERKIKGYSENSRVGRAMTSILDYVTLHQPSYHGITPFGGVPERVIRQEFGNNPDTSKALRFLVSEKRIVRKGMGGRRDPFNYVLSNRSAAGTRARATSPAESAEENMGELNAQVVGATSLTPAAPRLGQIESAAAAAAALAAPSTGKWVNTAPRREVDLCRKPLQPRLSLGMTDAAAIEQGLAAVVGQKRAAPGAIAYTPNVTTRPAQPPAKRPATAGASTTAADERFVAGFMATVIAGAAAQEESAFKANATKAPAPTPAPATGTAAAPTPAMKNIPASSFITPAPKTNAMRKDKPADWMAWPSQLPSGQRLTTLASPPPLNSTTPGAMFLLPGATPQQQQQAVVTQAYLLQLQAALWKQQMVQKAESMAAANASAAAGGTAATASATPPVFQATAGLTPAPAPATAGPPPAAVNKAMVPPQKA